MDGKSIKYVLSKLPVSQVSVGSQNVYCTCPLAKWQHPKGTDSNPSMSVKVASDGDSLVRCWGTACGFSGTLTSLVSLLSAFEDGKYDDLLDEVRKLEKADLDARLKSALASHHGQYEERKEIFYEDRELDPYKGSVPRYILDRGFEVATCKEWELGFDRRKNRLVVPVRDTKSRLVGMMGRAVLPDLKPKWWAYWHFLKSKYLYGEHKLSYGSGEPERLIIVEGMLDVLWLWQMGVMNAVSIQGSKISDDQVQRMLDIGLPVYLMLDGDDSGREGQEKGKWQLRGKVQVNLCKCPDGRDPGDLSREEVDHLIESAEYVL
jgi:hypothetical protein